MSAEIIVSGSAELRVVPDFARIRVAVDGEGDSHAQAYDAAREVATSVDAVLAEHEALLQGASASSIVVQPRTRWDGGEPVRIGWRAARTTLLEVDAAQELSRLLSDLAAAGASVSGPDWEVAPDNPVHAEVRAAAAREAAARAQSYAAGLGVQVGGVAWVAEPGLRRGTASDEEGRDGFAVARAASAGGYTDDEPMAVAPGELTVRARVEVAFTLGSNLQPR